MGPDKLIAILDWAMFDYQCSLTVTRLTIFLIEIKMIMTTISSRYLPRQCKAPPHINAKRLRGQVCPISTQPALGGPSHNPHRKEGRGRAAGAGVDEGSGSSVDTDDVLDAHALLFR